MGGDAQTARAVSAVGVSGRDPAGACLSCDKRYVLSSAFLRLSALRAPPKCQKIADERLRPVESLLSKVQ